MTPCGPNSLTKQMNTGKASTLLNACKEQSDMSNCQNVKTKISVTFQKLFSARKGNLRLHTVEHGILV